MDDMEAPRNAVVIKITENLETAPDETEVLSADSNSISDWNEITSESKLESIHSSIQSSLEKEGSVHYTESGSIITIAPTDGNTIQDEQEDQDDVEDQEDQWDKGDQRDNGDQGNQGNQGYQEDQEEREEQGDQENKGPKRRAHDYICVILLTFMCMTIPFIWYHLDRKDEAVIRLGQAAEDVQYLHSNDSCPFWHLLGDNYCDDEANTLECGYDFNDCCKIESDRSTCTDCLCFIPENKKIMLEEEFQKKCLGSAISWATYFGDGLCDLGFNNEEHFFDIGDCCQENAQCMSSTLLSTKGDGDCVEDNCIQSNIFCVKEELGDGICQGYNNGPYCEHDLGDCCLPTESQTNYTCNSECFMDAFYQIPSHWGFLG